VVRQKGTLQHLANHPSITDSDFGQKANRAIPNLFSKSFEEIS
jgi:hypothetical protein